MCVLHSFESMLVSVKNLENGEKNIEKILKTQKHSC